MKNIILSTYWETNPEEPTEAITALESNVFTDFFKTNVDKITEEDFHFVKDIDVKIPVDVKPKDVPLLLKEVNEVTKVFKQNKDNIIADIKNIRKTFRDWEKSGQILKEPDENETIENFNHLLGDVLNKYVHVNNRHNGKIKLRRILLAHEFNSFIDDIKNIEVDAKSAREIKIELEETSPIVSDILTGIKTESIDIYGSKGKEMFLGLIKTLDVLSINLSRLMIILKMFKTMGEDLFQGLKTVVVEETEVIASEAEENYPGFKSNAPLRVLEVDLDLKYLNKKDYRMLNSNACIFFNGLSMRSAAYYKRLKLYDDEEYLRALADTNLTHVRFTKASLLEDIRLLKSELKSLKAGITDLKSDKWKEPLRPAAKPNDGKYIRARTFTIEDTAHITRSLIEVNEMLAEINTKAFEEEVMKRIEVLPDKLDAKDKELLGITINMISIYRLVNERILEFDAEVTEIANRLAQI